MAKNRFNPLKWLDGFLRNPEKTEGSGVDVALQVRLHRLLFLLLPALEAAGFQFSPDRVIRLKRLLALLPPATDGAALGHTLCPVFATDPKQQVDFFALFNRIYEQVLAEEAAEKAATSENKKSVKTSGNPESDQPTDIPSKTEDQAEDSTDISRQGSRSNLDEPLPSSNRPTIISQRPLVVELDRCTDPPYTWNIVPDDDEVSVETGGTFGQTLLRLRRRETSETESLDIAATVDATIENGGRAELRYRSHTRPTEYLLLVERFSAEDHRAGLFDYFFQTLRANEVLVDRFFYQGDLRICRNEQHPAGLSLLQLRYRYPDSRLLVVGTGYRLLSPATGELSEWAEPLHAWRVRVLLTPVAHAAWGQREQKLGEVFSLLPASLHSLHFVAESPEEATAGQYDALPEYIRRIAEAQPLVLGESVLRSLRQHFDPGLLAWIATCAIYPAMHFDLTLRLGRLTSEALGYNLVTAANLLALARLPWFTAGQVPPEVRSELVDFLEARHPALHSRVIEYLHSLLERNPPPENSAAWAEHRINLALLTVLRDEQPDAALLDELRAVVKRLERSERRGDFVLPRAWEKMLEGLGWEEKLAIPSSNPNEHQEHKAPILPVKEENSNLTEPYDPALDLSSYEYPHLQLLAEYDNTMLEIDREELETNKNQIIQTLLYFKIEIEKIRAIIGPTVTLFEIIPAKGIRISKIKYLEDDIAINLSALGIRIIAPIPGKAAIGIEVPNKNRQIVGVRELLANERFLSAKMILPIALGKTIQNEVFVADLTEIPHLLIAGVTEQGQSLIIDVVLMSLLYKKNPSQVKLILINLKKADLFPYARLKNQFLGFLPDQMEPIVTNTVNAMKVLKSLIIEMETRFDLLKKAEVRNILEYNHKLVAQQSKSDKEHRYLPYIVLIIDEFADLIIASGKEAESSIGRLAQLARTVGIHLVIATQRPSVNIITSVIKANFPARIAFKVGSKVDSRSIIDTSGAEQLTGGGDMLLKVRGDIIRLQSAFVDRPDVERVIDFIANQPIISTPFFLSKFHPNRENIPAAQAHFQVDKKVIAGDEEVFKKEKPQIYISYRASDSLSQARYLHVSIEEEFGEGIVFYDKNRRTPGFKWPQRLAENIQSASVVLVLIANSNNWLGTDDSNNNRMDNSDDWVRKEIETALADSQKLVIPILINYAKLPPEKALPESLRPLLSRQHKQLREAHWDDDLLPLVKVIMNALPQPEEYSDLLEIPIPEIIHVLGGTFQMGSNEHDDEMPNHAVTLSDFKIGKYPVTNKQFCAFLNDKNNQKGRIIEWINLNGSYGNEQCRIQSINGKRFLVSEGYENHPVIFVSWFGAKAYCQWISNVTGRRYRLPSEAEWEFAACGGIQSKGFQYSGSNDLKEVGWFSENSDSQSHPVGQKKPNELDLYDMSGNVWEWCNDWYEKYVFPHQTNPKGPKSGSDRVFRGGAWLNVAQYCRVANRGKNLPEIRNFNIGFRVASPP